MANAAAAADAMFTYDTEMCCTLEENRETTHLEMREYDNIVGTGN